MLCETLRIVYYKFVMLKLTRTSSISLIVLTSPSTVHLPPLRCDNLDAPMIEYLIHLYTDQLVKIVNSAIWKNHWIDTTDRV